MEASSPPRANRRPRDMVFAMVVLMVPVVLIVALYLYRLVRGLLARRRA